MKIPKRFKLFGETIKVIVTNELESRTNHLGETHYRYNELQLNDNKNRSKDVINATFWHEFMHIALNKISENELSDNEKFVSIMGNLIHQALETMEY